VKGLAFLGDRKLAFLEVPDPAPGVGEVVVQIKASGMCGSDLHYFRAPHNPALPMQRRVIGGHEPCGIVAAVGAGVPAHVARIGDRVMVHHYHGCTTCAHCRTGWPQLCAPATRVVYSVHAHGGHAPYMKARADTLIPLHDALSFEAGAAIACGTGTAWGALQRAQVAGDETVVVYGQGPVGLSATLLAAARGARVIAIDIDDARLALAEAFGAAATLNADKTDAPATIRELTAGRGAQVAIETSGSTQAASAALRSVDVWGKVCFVGLGGTVAFEVRAFLDRQINVMTSYSMSSVGQMECAAFVVERGLDLDRLFTDRWRLDQAEEAYAKFDRQSSGKGAIVF
jgi:threonine dehydrogenase-like Zn-dependent dehydrogenase